MFLYYKIYLLVFFILFLISFITGIMTSAYYISSISCENLINKYLYNFLTKSSSMLSFFLILSIFFVLISLFFIFFTSNNILVCLNITILCLCAYIFGFDICIIVATLGLSGIIFGIFIMGIGGMFTFCILITILSISCKKLKLLRKACDSMSKQDYCKLFVLLIFIGILALLLLCFMFSCIHIFVIVD